MIEDDMTENHEQQRFSEDGNPTDPPPSPTLAVPVEPAVEQVADASVPEATKPKAKEWEDHQWSPAECAELNLMVRINHSTGVTEYKNTMALTMGKMAQPHLVLDILRQMMETILIDYRNAGHVNKTKHKQVVQMLYQNRDAIMLKTLEDVAPAIEQARMIDAYTAKLFNEYRASRTSGQVEFVDDWPDKAKRLG